MEPIYVTGHRNPDTDSIVSAMAYAALRNALGDREYQAVRLGHISDETRRVLDRFGFQPPARISTVRTQIRDLDFDVPPILNRAVPVRRGWEALQTEQGPAVPVADDAGGLFGMLTPSDIARHNMQFSISPYLDQIPVFNLLSVLEGRLLGERSDLVDTVSGEVIVALPQKESIEFHPDSIVLCGQQPETARQALEQSVSCLILCQAQIPEELFQDTGRTCVLSTPLDACRACHQLFQSIPVDRICHSGALEHIHLDDFLDDVREVVLRSRYRSYPILDSADKVVGTLSRFHLIRPKRKRVVLVDHNEFSQSVHGLEQAEILEIIDHHRLADIQTNNPIYVRNEPVGSTATIVAGMYQEKGLMPPKNLAGLIAAAIVSDTVLFQSPTCTEQDRRMADRMARLAGVTLEELGKTIFEADGREHQTAEELLLSDFKEFRIAGHFLAVGQVTTLDAERLLTRKDEFLAVMKPLMAEKGYDFLLLILTDVLRAGSYLLHLGGEDTIRQAFGVEPKDSVCFLPNTISRKKQIIPMLSALWG